MIHCKTLSGLLLLAFACLNCSGRGDNNAQTIVAADTTEVSVPRSSEISIVFAGDAMQHKRQLAAARRRDGSYDYSGYFTAVEPYIRSADYAVVNLETTLGERNFSGYPMFCSPDSYAEELQRAGFDMLLTANNHCLDTRDKGLIRTLDVLDRLGVDHVGTYRNHAERDSVIPKIIDIEGFKVGFLDYTYATNGIRIQGNVVVDYIDKNQIRTDLALLREAGAEVLCVNMHWGDEYKLLPVSSQRALADFLVDEGVDLIIGGHPHVIQPIEIRRSEKFDKDILLVYSLGNFISGMKKIDTQGGIMVKTTLRRDEAGKPRVAHAEYLPVFVIPGTPGVDNYRLVIADSCDVPAYRQRARAFITSATNIFNKHNKGVGRSTEF